MGLVVDTHTNTDQTCFFVCITHSRKNKEVITGLMSVGGLFNRLIRTTGGGSDEGQWRAEPVVSLQFVLRTRYIYT
jgi:hypothetical protein